LRRGQGDRWPPVRAGGRGRPADRVRGRAAGGNAEESALQGS